MTGLMVVWGRTGNGKGNDNSHNNDKSAEQKVYIPPFAKCMRRMGHPSV